MKPYDADQVKPQPLLTPTVKVHRVMVDNFVTDVVKHEDFVRAITNARTERDEAKDKEWSAKLADLPRSDPKEAGDALKALELLKELHPLERVIPTRGQKKAWWAIGALEAYLSAPAKSEPDAEGVREAVEKALDYMVDNGSYTTTREGRIALKEAYIAALGDL